MKQLVARTALIVTALIWMFSPTAAQVIGPPQDQVVWELATWAGENPLGQAQTQDGSGEDWLYSITQSKTAQGVMDGYVAAGYTSYPGTSSTVGCQIPCSSLYGCFFATLKKIGPGGEVEWHRDSGVSDTFWKVINTSDGGFLAVGHTHDRSLLTYNPTRDKDGNVVGISLNCWPEQGNVPDSLWKPRRRVMFAAKYDHDGNPEWKYAYGQMDDPNDHLYGGSLHVQERHDTPWDVVERPDGGFRLVACGSDPGTGMNTRAFVADIGADGMVQNRQVYGEASDPNDPLTWKRSMLMGIERWGDEYVAVGTQFNDQFEQGFGDVFVIKLGATLTPQPVAQTTLTSSPGEQDTGFNVAFTGDGTVLVASVLDCVADFGQCRLHGAGGEGDLVVHPLKRSTLASLGSTGSALGRVKAFDVLVGMASTSDGGVALVSTKQPDGPIDIDRPTDNTDAFVAKLSSTGSVLWTTTYDARTSRVHFEDGYEKHQECLYDIAETEDGGLVIAGNNSSNLDDGYVVRFGTATAKTLPATTVANSHLVYPTAAQPYTAELTGDLEVAETGRVWVDPGRTLAFGPGVKLRVRGTLSATGAMFQENDPRQGWGGIEISNPGGADPTATFTDSIVEGVEFDGFTSQAPAVVFVYNATADFSGTTIQGGMSSGGGAVAGLSVAGSRADVTVRDQSLIRLNSGDGIIARSDAEVDARDSFIRENTGSGVVAGSDAIVHLFQNQITDNDGYGVHATDYGQIAFSRPHGEGNWPDGLNFVSNNLAGGLLADGGGTVNAGMEFWETGGCLQGCFNTIEDHSWSAAPFDAKAADYGTVWAMFDFWGDEVSDEDDLVLIEESGGIVTVDTVLTIPPMAARPSGAPLAESARTAPSSGTALRSGSPRVLLRAARAAAAEGEHGEAFALLREVIETAEADYRRLAYTEALRLLREAQPPGVMAFLENVGAGESPYRPWALRALVAGYEAAEQPAQAEAAAGVLVADYGGSRHALFGHLARVHLRLRQDDPAGAEAALVEAEAGWPEHPSVAAARGLLGWLTDAEQTVGRGSGDPDAEEKSTTEEGSKSEAATYSLSAYPNPSRGALTVALALATASEVRLVVYDVLGREVAVLADRAFEAGPHDVVSMAPRSRAGSTSSAPRWGPARGRPVRSRRSSS